MNRVVTKFEQRNGKSRFFGVRGTEKKREPLLKLVWLKCTYFAKWFSVSLFRGTGPSREIY